MAMSPTLCCAGNVFAGSIFCWCRCTCKSRTFYPNSCLFLFGYSNFNTNLTMPPNTLLHYFPQQTHRAIIPPANIGGLIQPQGSTASWPKGDGVVTDPALRKLCLGSFFSGNFNRAVLGLTEKKGRYQAARKCLSEWIHSCRLTARHESRKGSRSTFLVYQKI